MNKKIFALLGIFVLSVVSVNAFGGTIYRAGVVDNHDAVINKYLVELDNVPYVEIVHGYSIFNNTKVCGFINYNYRFHKQDILEDRFNYRVAMIQISDECDFEGTLLHELKHNYYLRLQDEQKSLEVDYE